jgi:hypothetical protein
MDLPYIDESVRNMFFGLFQNCSNQECSESKSLTEENKKEILLPIRKGPVVVNGIKITDTISAFSCVKSGLTINCEGAVLFPERCMLHGATERIRLGKNRVNVTDLMCALFKQDVKKKGSKIVHASASSGSGALFCLNTSSKRDSVYSCINPLHMACMYNVIMSKTLSPKEGRTAMSKKGEYMMLVEEGILPSVAARICDISKQWERKVKREIHDEKVYNMNPPRKKKAKMNT